MSDQAPTPEHTLELMNIFLRRFGTQVLNYANMLDYAEENAKKRRRETPHDPTLMPEGTFRRQADALQGILDMFALAVKSDALPTPDPEDPFALQEKFNKAVGALNMIIDENKELEGRLKRKGNQRRMEAKYRETHYIPDGDDLDPKIVEKIAARSREYRNESGSITKEVMELTDIVAGLNEIRGGMFRRRSGLSGGGGVGSGGGGVVR